MSVIKFELKEEHISLLKHFKSELIDDKIVLSLFNSEDEEALPTKKDDFYEYFGLIIYGKPENFDPLTSEEPIKYTSEQKAEMTELFSQLPMALSIVLDNPNVKAGTYKTKYHLKEWKQIN